MGVAKRGSGTPNPGKPTQVHLVLSSEQARAFTALGCARHPPRSVQQLSWLFSLNCWPDNSLQFSRSSYPDFMAVEQVYAFDRFLIL
jgi:hypothetical protein